MDYCASKFGAVGIHEALTSELTSPKYSGVPTTCVSLLHQHGPV